MNLKKNAPSAPAPKVEEKPSRRAADKNLTTVPAEEIITSLHVEANRVADVLEAMLPAPSELARAQAAIAHLRSFGAVPANPIPRAPKDIR